MDRQRQEEGEKLQLLLREAIQGEQQINSNQAYFQQMMDPINI